MYTSLGEREREVREGRLYERSASPSPRRLYSSSISAPDRLGMSFETWTYERFST